MLVKEYRICMPMSVEEYRIGQLYMIQKKSRNESSGSDSGVEILTNEPYEDGPGGSGQYTFKIYHVGSHMPGWIRSILPKSVHIVEEAWNAYPYTKTIYRCPFIEKFVMEIETVYHNDSGTQQNVFDLSKSDLSSRTVDYIDMVKDPISSNEYQVDEDPTKFVSAKTGRGPLSENWREEYAREISSRGNSRGTGDHAGGRAKKEMMCAYKLCKVEFNYWGMQSKVERFIHDYALRRIMVRAHRQAWCWQDEYHGLTIEDIRRLELETQIKLREKMASQNETLGSKVDQSPAKGGHYDGTCVDIRQSKNNSNDRLEECSGDTSPTSLTSKRTTLATSSKECKNIEKLQNSSSDEEEEEEFFDADEAFSTLQRRSGFDPLSEPQPSKSTPTGKVDGLLQQSSSSSQSLPASPTPERKNPLSSLDLAGSEMLFILLHGGSIVDTADQGACSKGNDLSTLISTFESVIRLKYPSMSGKIFVEMVTCPNLCSRPFQLLSAISSQRSFPGLGKTVAHNKDQPAEGYYSGSFGANFPLSSLVLFGVNDSNYLNMLNQVRTMVNKCYSKFCQVSLRRAGAPFTGQIYLLGDAIGGLFAFDLITPPTKTSSNQKAGAISLDVESSKCSSTANQTQEDVFLDFPEDVSQTPTFNSFEEDNESESSGLKMSSSTIGRHLSCPGSTICEGLKVQRLDFDVDEVFLFGAPLGLMLAYRLHNQLYPLGHLPRPSCNQLYNLFYPSDPCTFRVEPLLDLKFQFVEPIKLSRFNKFLHDEMLSVYLVEALHNNSDLFGDSSSSNEVNDIDDNSFNDASSGRSLQDGSVQSQLQSGVVESVSLNWWGSKRVDYSMYCPEVLQNFPPHSLPSLLHSSFWESSDLVAFILRQALKQDLISTGEEVDCPKPLKASSVPKEKWLKRRTTIKVRNIAPNHRANDVIVLEGKPQTLTARFMYGPLDVITLSGEKVDIFVTVKGQKELMATEVTDTNGRVVYNIPDGRRLPIGLYSVQMVVRVDQSSASFSMAVLPPKTEVVVFSIDGSFTASVSILGRDPKVRAGAVDVVRYWHDLGYLIHYITARPDMQHKMVVRWLTQHNFPQGLAWFTDGLSAEPLRQKASHLRQLIREAQIVVSAAYGSNKDVFVYQTIGLQPEQMFIVGKVSKKNKSEATVISDGYAPHLSNLGTLSNYTRSVNLKLSFRTGGFAVGHCQPGPSRPQKPPRSPLKVSLQGDLGRSFRAATSGHSFQRRSKQEPNSR